MEKFSPEAENLVELCQVVSALVVAASGLHVQVQDRSVDTFVRTLAVRFDPTVNGCCVLPARPFQGMSGHTVA